MGRRNRTRYPGIYKTPRGDYMTYVLVEGKQRWKTFGKNVREAMAWRADMQSKLRHGELRDASLSRVRFAEFAELHLGDQLHYEQRTHDVTATVVRVHVLPHWGHRRLSTISRRDVQDWIKELTQQRYARGGKTKHYSPTTIRDIYKHFRKIMGAAVDEGYVSPNPCRRIQLPKLQRAEQRFLTEHEVEDLVAAMDHRYGALVYVSAYLGLRWEEVSALKPRDLELDGPTGIVHVRGTLPRSDGRIAYRPYGKTASARRSLKVPEFLRQALTFHLASYSNANWVFPAPKGGFLRGDNFRTRSWTPATEECGLAAGSDVFTFHELRHTAAAFMIDEGADPLQVMRRMGHSDIRTTYNLYGHLFPDREDDLVAKLDERYSRALGADGKEEKPALEENGFDFSLTRRPFDGSPD